MDNSDCIIDKSMVMYETNLIYWFLDLGFETELRIKKLLLRHNILRNDR